MREDDEHIARREEDAHNFRIFGLVTCFVIVWLVASTGLEWWMTPMITAVLVYLAIMGNS